MATVKQLNMLSAKARAAGLDFDREVCKNYGNEAIDAMVAEFDANGGKQKQEQKETTAPKEPEINHVRFGMACKLVIQQTNYQWALCNPLVFIKRVEELYRLLNKAEAAVSAASGGN